MDGRWRDGSDGSCDVVDNAVKRRLQRFNRRAYDHCRGISVIGIGHKIEKAGL